MARSVARRGSTPRGPPPKAAGSRENAGVLFLLHNELHREAVRLSIRRQTDLYPSPDRTLCLDELVFAYLRTGAAHWMDSTCSLGCKKLCSSEWFRCLEQRAQHRARGVALVQRVEVNARRAAGQQLTTLTDRLFDAHGHDGPLVVTGRFQTIA